MTAHRPFPPLLRTPDHPEGRTPDVPPQIVFHHQPKTAGSTFRQMLESLFDRNEVCRGEIDDEVRELSDDARNRLRLFAGHFRYDTIDDFFPDALWLVLVRNPIDRVVSNYYNLRDPNRYVDAWIRRAEARPKVKRFLDMVQKMTLEEFVFSDERRARDRVVNRQTRYLVRKTAAARSHPMYDEAMLAEAKRNLRERFVYVAVQEHFGLAVQLFCMTFGLPPIHDSDRFTTNVNTSERTRRGYQLSDEVRTALEEANRMDLELWREAESIMFERLLTFQKVLIENEYVIRREFEAFDRPIPIRQMGLEPRRLTTIMSFVKRTLPEPVIRLIKAGLPSR